MKHNCVKKPSLISCVHTQRLLMGSYQGFRTLPLRSKGQNGLKIPQKPYKYPLKIKGKGVEKERRGDRDRKEKKY
jgi:hypothetical protein